MKIGDYHTSDDSFKGTFWRQFVNLLPEEKRLRTDTLSLLLNKYLIGDLLREFEERNLGRYNPTTEVAYMWTNYVQSKGWKSDSMRLNTGLYNLELADRFFDLHTADMTARLRRQKRANYTGIFSKDPHRLFVLNAQYWMSNMNCPLAFVESLYRPAEWSEMQSQVTEWFDLGPKMDESRQKVTKKGNPRGKEQLSSGLSAIGTLLRIERFRDIVHEIWADESALNYHVRSEDLSFLNLYLGHSAQRLTQLSSSSDATRGSSTPITKLLLIPRFIDHRNSRSNIDFLEKLLTNVIIDFAIHLSAVNQLPATGVTGKCVECGSFFEKILLGSGKRYCGATCKARANKRNQRNKARIRLHRNSIEE